MTDDAPARFHPGQLITIAAYAGKLRNDEGEVYKTEWSYGRNDWRISVRLFVAEGQAVQWRNFYQQQMEAV